MIRSYRCVEYDGEILVTFQGDVTDVDALYRILGFKPRLSKKNDLVEKGYYFYLRDGGLRKLDSVLNYFKQNFTGPDVETSLFLADDTLPDDRPREDWARTIENRILNAFQERGYLIGRGGHGYEIFRNPTTNGMQSRHSKRVFITEGVTYHVNLTDEYRPVLYTDVVFSLVLDGSLTTTHKLPRQLPEKAQAIIQEYQQVTTYDTREMFHLLCNFMKGLGQIVKLPEGISFSNEPANSQDLEFETWVWEHHHPPQIQVGDGALVPLTQHVIDREFGVYKKPPIQPILFLLHPSTDARKWTSLQWQGLYQQFAKPIRILLQENLPVHMVEYQIGGDGEQAVNKCKQILESEKERVPLFIILGPERPDRNCNDHELLAVDKLAFAITKQLRRLRRGSYTETITWQALDDKHTRQYVIENTLLKMITVVGGLPWRIMNIPATCTQNSDDVAFIGIDLDSQQRDPKVVGVIFDSFGVLRAFYVARLDPAIGDVVPPDIVSYMVKALMYHFADSTSRYPRHLIIHRDGKMQSEEVNAFEKVCSELSIDYDLVEIKKNLQPRMRQLGNLSGTPSKDVAVGGDQSGLAIMCNTHVVNEQITERVWKFPAPRSLLIQRRHGTTPIKTLCAQIYCLSLANYNSFRRTNYLPVTVTYSDAFVANLRLKDRQTHFTKAIKEGNSVVWL